jgi:DNA-binding CsgD family transcriptional regulator
MDVWAESRSTALNWLVDPILMVDAAFHIIYANDRFARMVKKDSEGIIGKKCFEVFHGVKEPPSHCLHHKALSSGQPVSELFFEPCLNRDLLISVSLIKNNHNKITGSIHVVKEVENIIDKEELTRFALKVNEELRVLTLRLMEATERLKEEISEKSRAETAFAGDSYNVEDTRIHEPYKRMAWHVADKSLIGPEALHSIFGIYHHPADPSVVINLIEPTDRSGFIDHTGFMINSPSPRIEGQFRITRPDHQERVIHGIVNKTGDSHGPEVIVGLFRDVTERAQWFDVFFADAKTLLLQASYLLQGIAANSVFDEEKFREEIVHRIRHWITRLIVARSIVRETEQLLSPFDKKSAEHMHEISREITHLAINGHRLTRRIRPPSLETTDLAGLLKKECMIFGERQGSRIALEVTCPEISPVPTKIAHSLLEIVLEYLNSALHEFGANTMHVALSHDERMIRLELRDNGTGHHHPTPRLGPLIIDLGVRLVRGTIRIEPSPETGAIMIVDVPFSHNSRLHTCGLNDRQQEILSLLAQGKVAKEIAFMLHLSPKTVEFHKYTMMKNLGIRSVPELIRFGIRHKLLPP